MTGKKKRIFMVGYSTDKGGVESYIKNICELLKADFDIIFHWPFMKIDGKEWVIPKNRHNFLRYRRFWHNFFKENKFDVIYYNTCDIVSIDLLKFAKKGNIPVRIIHSHNTGNQIPGRGLIGLLHNIQERLSRKQLHRFATHLLACSASAGDWMYDGRDYIVIKNGITLSKFRYSPEKEQSVSCGLKTSSHPVVACIGRLDSQKNPFFSLEIFKSVCTLNRDAQCLFIGDGEHRSKLEETVVDCGLEDRILFTGGVDNVNEWLSYVDCIIMPSLFEGLPFSLVEAQAAGLHCLVSDTVSEESNITGLVKFKSLKDTPESWAKKALQLSRAPRVDVTSILKEKGYSIIESAQTVKGIIEKVL